MKHISLLTLFFTIFFFNQPAFSADLDSKIMRRVNAANLSLDKAEEQIKVGRSEFAPGKVESARKEYKNIFNYYQGRFDPNHPVLVQLKRRIDGITAQLSSAKEEAAKSSTQAVTGVQANTQSKLSANIRRRISNADNKLVWVKEAVAKGNDATSLLAAAKGEYSVIFEYYKGSFDPNHPDIVALKNRIDAAEMAMKKGMAEKDATTMIETNSRVVGDLPAQVGTDLIGIAGSLRTLENRLDTASKSNKPDSYLHGVKSDLKIVMDKFVKFNSSYGGQFDPGHVAYVQVRTRLDKAKAAVSELAAGAEANAAAKLASASSANSAEAQKIMKKYQQMAPASSLHKNNLGRMVWSGRQMSFGDQDTVPVKSTFKLSDPIYGRLYLEHSLGNTPVYSRGDTAKPAVNRDFGYEFRLFIDGQEKAVKFGVFDSGNLSGKAGETWTTWQFVPNPIPFLSDFSNEADAWRGATRNLTAGSHAIRFELWGVQGQYKTRKPISIGEFTLIVGEGDRIAAGLLFPKDSYSGADLAKIRAEIIKAIVGPVAKSRAEVLKVSVTSDWRQGAYTDSKKLYRKISGTILWYDKDNDSVCRFNTYNFISNHLGGNNWTPLKYRSFAMGMEGDTECL